MLRSSLVVLALCWCGLATAQDRPGGAPNNFPNNIGATLGDNQAAAQDRPAEILLWPNGAPGSEGQTAAENVATNRGEDVVTNVHKPSITPYIPDADKATGVAVIVAPGGGHFQLSMTSEGYNVAERLKAAGVAAFVLKNRLARTRGPGGPPSPYTIEEHALGDMKRAIRIVRSRAAEWKIDPEKIGALGFSAGGELVFMNAQSNTDGNPEAADPIDRESSKIAFQALIYSGQSRLIQPTENSPPAFIVAGFKDRQDISEGMADVYLRFKKAGVPAELHIYTEAAHGFGAREANDRFAWGRWPDRFVDWLHDRNLIARPAN